jgi:hypothetical protein
MRRYKVWLNRKRKNIGFCGEEMGRILTNDMCGEKVIMKFLIDSKNDVKEEKEEEGHFYLSNDNISERDVVINLMLDEWCILGITREGRIRFYRGLPDDIGLVLDKVDESVQIDTLWESHLSESIGKQN